MKFIARTRQVKGSLEVTLPQKFVEKQGICEGEWLAIKVKKIKEGDLGMAKDAGYRQNS